MSKKAKSVKRKSVKRKSVKRKSVKRKSVKRKNVKHGGNPNNKEIPDHPLGLINKPFAIINNKNNQETTSNSTNVLGIIKVNPDLPPNENPVNRAGWFGVFVIISTIGYLVLK